MKVFVILLLALLWFYPVQAQECVQEPVQLVGTGEAVTFFEPGVAYDVVQFGQPMDELIFLVLNTDYKYEFIHQDTSGFTVRLFLDQSSTFDRAGYTYLAGGFRCQTYIYQVRLPFIVQ